MVRCVTTFEGLNVMSCKAGMRLARKGSFILLKFILLKFMNNDLDPKTTLYPPPGGQMAFEPGQRVFERYELMEEIGHGGMGVVWMAYDGTLKEEVALKFLPESLAKDARAVSDLKSETARAHKLKHPNIVRVYDFKEDVRRAAISMECVNGKSLAALMHPEKEKEPAKHFEVAELRPWVRQLCDALEYAHEKAKVVHRDLKPANLMINEEGKLIVMDFGISATLTDATTRVSQQARRGGTSAYMSPQQMMGDTPSETDDVYSLGATLYELLTGEPPFYRGDIGEQVREKTPPRMSARRAELGKSGKAIPVEWEETVAACLAKDPKQRPKSAAEVRARLGLDEAVEPDKKWRKVLLTVAGACVLALAGLGYYYYGVLAPAKERAETEKRVAAQKAEQEQAQARLAAVEKREAELKAAQEKLEADKARMAAEKAEQERLAEAAKREAADKAEQERLAAAERDRQAEAAKQAAAQKAEQERLAAAKAEQERQAEVARREAAAKAEQERMAEAERDRQAEAARLAASLKAEAEQKKLAAEKQPQFGQSWTVPLLNLELVPIAPGSFLMGGTGSDEKPVRQVTLTKPFWLGKYAVTQGQWEALMGTTVQQQSKKKDEKLVGVGADYPMYDVSWEDAMAFCRKLTERERAAGRLPEGLEFTLPTEAQWEYACRAGTTGDYAGKLDEMGWYGKDRNGYGGNSKAQAHPVGQKKANAWGLYDMHGNVWELCLDWYDSGYYAEAPATDPTGPGTGFDRVVRGGSLYTPADFCRSARRSKASPGDRGFTLGFRVALSSIKIEAENVRLAIGNTANGASATTRFDSNLVTLEKFLISSPGTVGGDVQYKVRATANANVTNVTITENIPNGVDIISFGPDVAKGAGNTLTWSYPEMQKGMVREVLITVRPTQEGTFAVNTKISVDPVPHVVFTPNNH